MRPLHRKALATLAFVLLMPTVPTALRGQDVQPKEEKAKADKKKSLPLVPERKIEFTTDEGTWISLDVSPDGQTILLELLGDLYTLPIAGGEARPLTSGMAFDSQPRYSPDGRRIVFLSDREGAENVWTMSADGTDARAITKDEKAEFASPAFTPDGDYVIVSKNPEDAAAFELWMYHVKGGSGVQVTKAKPKPDLPRDKQPNVLGAVASPDGRFFYYARKTGGFQYDILDFPLWQVVRRDRTTGDEDPITDAPGSAFRPVLSPDGKILVYGTRHETETALRLRNLATGEDRWLVHPVQRDDQESRSTRDLLPGYAFTPDGRALVANFDGGLHRIDMATGQVTRIPFTAKVAQDMGPLLDFPARVDQGDVRARLAQGAMQSPDGRRLAFSALTHLYVMDLPSGKPRRVTTSGSGEYQPAWSPDGRSLAYVTWSVAGGQVMKTAADGRTPPRALTAVGAYYREPVFTPDGTQVVALRGARRVRMERENEWGGLPPGMDVVVIPAQGGDARVVVPTRGASHPHFTAEKDRLFLYSPEGLVSLRLDGSDRRTVVKLVGKGPGPEPPPADSAVLSPDGRYALALVNQQLYLTAVPRVGGETPSVNVQSPSVAAKKLTEVGADSFAFADGGATITWSLGASFFRQPLKSVDLQAPTDEEKKASEEKAAADGSPAGPDQVTPKETKPAYEEIEIEVTSPRHRPKGVALLRGARIVTMKGDEILPDGELLVTDNRITAVGSRGSVTVPAGARVFDLQGKTVIPGLIDTHAHWTEVRHGVLDLSAWTFLANLAYGVTTGRDPQTMTNDMFAYQDLLEAGAMLGPRAFSTGPGIFSDTDFQSLEEARSTVAKYKKYYRTNTLKSYVVGNRRQRQFMVTACKEHGIMPTTEGALDLKLDLTHVLDGFSGNEHALPIVPLFKDVSELVARSGLSYTPTLLVAYGGPFAENHFYTTTEVHDDPKLRRFIPGHLLHAKSARRRWFRKDEHVFPKLAASAAKIVRSGGRVCIGGHGQLQGIQCHWEMWALESGGLTPHEVLRAATLHGAQAIGYAQDLGSLEPGKLADLVVLDADPLADLHNSTKIRYVMKDGEMFDGATLDQVWPIEKPLEPLWWWDDVSPADRSSGR